MQDKHLLQVAKRYTTPSVQKSLIQILNTFVPFIGLLILMYWLNKYSYWFVLLLSIPSAAFLLRLFIIQHDCGHGSFFRSDFFNSWSGRIIGLFTLTPYTFWKSNHSAHHATSGDLDRRSVGDVPTMTVSEYMAASTFGKLVYRFYRNPIALLPIGAPGLFILAHRFPWYVPMRDTRLWLSVMSYNIALTISFWILIKAFGVSVIFVYLPVICFAAMAGIYMFYIQHQFDGTYWQKRDDWNFVEAAMQGCSYHKLPGILNWFTGNIAFHHIHHLCSKIPNYELQRCFNDNAEFQKVKVVGLREGIRCFNLALWDEAQQRLISFKDLKN